jgi:NADPH:quinone reductase-like Zn-dependent oxidoreductase
MHAVVITEPGDPDVLRWEEVPNPVPGEGELLIDIATAGVNRADLLPRQGFYPPAGNRATSARSCC